MALGHHFLTCDPPKFQLSVRKADSSHRISSKQVPRTLPRWGIKLPRIRRQERRRIRQPADGLIACPALRGRWLGQSEALRFASTCSFAHNALGWGVLWSYSRGAMAGSAGGRKAQLCDGRSLSFRGPRTLALRRPAKLSVTQMHESRDRSPFARRH